MEVADKVFLSPEMFKLVNVAAQGKLDWPGSHRWRVRRLMLGAGRPFRKRQYAECLQHLWMACPTGDDRLLKVLRSQGHPGRGTASAVPSMVMLGRDDHLEHWDLDALIVCLSCRRHPVGEAARRLVAERRPRRVVDAVCDAALESPFLAGFCTREELLPADPEERAAFVRALRQGM